MKISFAAAAKLFLSAMVLLSPIVGQAQFTFTTNNSVITITLVLFCVSICVAVKKGFSFVEVVNERVDSVFVKGLQKWYLKIAGVADGSKP